MAHWDGLLPQKIGANGAEQATPDDLRAMAAVLAAHRPADAPPIDIVVEGETPGDDPAGARAITQPWRDAGATWWLEARWGDGRDAEARQRIRQGPPAGE